MGQGAIIPAENGSGGDLPPAGPAAPGQWWRQRRRRLLWLLLVAALLAGVWLQGPRWAAVVLRSRLQDMISSQFNARLEMDSLSYQFPYHLTARNARLITRTSDGQAVEILAIRQLDLRLARLPLGKGPLVIEELVLHEPSVHLIHTAAGLVGQRGLVKAAGNATDQQPITKLSEMLQLRHFAIERGRIAFEDQTRAGRLPLVWQDLQIDLHTAPKTSPVYAFAIVARNAALAQVTAAGTFNIDALDLKVIEFALKVKVDPADTQTPLPGELCDLLRRHQVAGVVDLHGWADVPLTHPADSRYAVLLELAGAKANMPQWGGRLDELDLKLRCTSDPPAGRVIPPLGARGRAGAGEQVVRPLYLNLQDCRMSAGDSGLEIANADLSIVWSARSWRIAELKGALTLGKDRTPLPDVVEDWLNRYDLRGGIAFSGGAAGPLATPAGRLRDILPELEVELVPRGLHILPPELPLALDDIGGGALHLRAGALDCEKLRARYGGDRIELAAAHALWEDAAQPVRVSGISGTLVLDGQERLYPALLAAPLEALRPTGTFRVSGDLSIERSAGADIDYKLNVSADDAALAVGPRRLPLSGVKFDMLLRPGLIDLSRDEPTGRRGLSGDLFGGTVDASGQIRTAGLLTYQGTARVEKADLARFAEAWAQAGEPPMKLSGRANLTMLVSGSQARADRTAADNFRARGEVEVLDGNFWQAPVVSQLLGKLPPTKGALTAGQAAGVFEICDQTVLFEKIAVSAPVLGLQGSGEVRFDGRLDMKVVAAPLADWREKLKQTNIPLVSNVAAELAGGVQKLINSATRNLIYAFRVTGTAQEPQVSTEPVPMLSTHAAALFGQMIRGGGNDRLLESVKNKGK